MDKSTVDSIIAEAMDACALDQIAKLNTAHLSSDSFLPSDLESRFRKLKSFPTKTTASPTFTATRSLNFGKENNAPPPQPPSVSIVSSSLSGSDNASASFSPVPSRAEKHIPLEAEKEIKLGSGVPTGDEIEPGNPKVSIPDFDLGSGFSPSKRRNTPSSSPLDRLGCCFFLSPKKSTGTTPKSKEKEGNAEAVYGMDLGAAELEKWLDNKKMLADIKEQQKKLKKALKEQDKVTKEAAKMVKWTKQASARMRGNIDELLSDDDDEDELGGAHFH